MKRINIVLLAASIFTLTACQSNAQNWKDISHDDAVVILQAVLNKTEEKITNLTKYHTTSSTTDSSGEKLDSVADYDEEKLYLYEYTNKDGDYSKTRTYYEDNSMYFAFESKAGGTTSKYYTIEECSSEQAKNLIQTSGKTGLFLAIGLVYSGIAAIIQTNQGSSSLVTKSDNEANLYVKYSDGEDAFETTIKDYFIYEISDTRNGGTSNMKFEYGKSEVSKPNLSDFEKK